MRAHSRRRAWLPLLLVLSLPVATHAEPAPAVQARGLTEGGLRKYQIGDYAGAIADFKHAYLLDPQPPLLYNIAQSYRLSGDCEAARRFYGNYLRDAPTAPNRSTVEGRMAEMQRCIEERAARPPEAVPAPAPNATPTPTPTPAPTTEAHPPVAAVHETPLAKPAPFRPRRNLQIAGFTSLGLGVVLVATGGAMSGLSAQASHEVGGFFSTGGQWNDHYASIESRGRSTTAASIALYSIGGAALVTGAVLTAIAFLPPKARRALAPSSNGSGLAWTF